MPVGENATITMTLRDGTGEARSNETVKMHTDPPGEDGDGDAESTIFDLSDPPDGTADFVVSSDIPQTITYSGTIESILGHRQRSRNSVVIQWSPYTLTVTVDATTNPADGSTVAVRGHLVLAGTSTPVAGKAVSLVSTGSSSGKLPQQTGVTDGSGNVVFNASSLIDETVTYVMNETSTDTASNQVDKTIDFGDAFVYGIATDATLIASVLDGVTSGTLNSTSLGTLTGLSEGPAKFWSVRTDSDIPGNFPGPPDATAALSLVTVDATNMLALSAVSAHAGSTRISGEIRKAVKVSGVWYGDSADQLYLMDTGSGLDPTHEFFQIDSGAGSNAPTFTGPNVTTERLDYIDPPGGPVYASGGAITITGTGFANGVNVASLDGTPIATVWVDAQTLTATIPASYPGNGKLTVSGRVGWFYLYN